MEHDKMEWDITDIDMKDVINEALESTHLINSQTSSIETIINIPDFVPIVRGDKARLVQVMENLLSNAAIYCDKTQGKIAISLETFDTFLKVKVSDNGIGISASDQTRVFEKFRQIPSAKTGRPPGPGLGLSITKRIIDYHKGMIDVESTIGKGSTFIFTIPVTQ
jgi:signal transduction histidine kinase